jgi:STE24 endopeptidase
VRRALGILVVRILIVLLAAGIAPAGWVLAQAPPPRNAAPAMSPVAPITPRLDPVTATEAYVARLTPEQIAKSDSYFEGGYWLHLWDFLVSSAISLILLTTGLAARMRNLAERVVSFRFAQGPFRTLLFGFQYFLFTTILSFPLSVYTGYFREHQYNLSNQTFGAWLKDALIGVVVLAVIGGIALMVLYVILQRVQKSWWLWASVASLTFLFIVNLLAPVYIAPLFNEYKTLDDPKIRDPILSLARANEIPADRVYVFDASKQTKTVSANVSGSLGTMRISLNDNLLNRCSLPSIRAVMAHEMGHYVLNHIYKGLIEMGLVLTIGFAFVAWGFQRIVARRGAAWGIRSIADPAGLPLIVLLFGIYFFVMTPVTNTITRTAETEADAFGLNAAGEPDGFADASLLLSEYRKMHPGKWEEIVFYDHPSGYNRILMAMTWKAEHPNAGSH